jgi:hypothetical protein
VTYVTYAVPPNLYTKSRCGSIPQIASNQEEEVSETANEQLIKLKGFTFDGETGRKLSDLYSAVGETGYTKDAPFVRPTWSGDNPRPGAVNSFLDTEGNRAHLIWQSDDSGLSRVVDIVLNAPSLAREATGDACEACGGDCGISGIVPYDD